MQVVLCIGYKMVVVVYVSTVMTIASLIF